MWNYEYKAYPSANFDVRNFDADTGAVADHARCPSSDTSSSDHFARGPELERAPLRRAEADKPNPNGLRYQQGLYPILRPFDLKGVGALGYRSNDPGKQDDSAVPAVAPPRAATVHRAAVRCPLRPGHRPSTATTATRPHRVMEWKYLGRARCAGCVSREKLPGEVERQGRLAFDDVLGATPRVS